MNEVVIEVSNVIKRYGSKMVLKGISFTVNEGEIFVVVGPNGSGKTTLLEIISGLRKPDNGYVRIFGFDPSDERARSLMGVVFQEMSFPNKAKVKECIEMTRIFYPNPLSTDEVLDMLDLTEYKDVYYENLSEGLKRRVAIAAALTGNAKLLLLDEPTAGLDPYARKSLWRILRGLRDEGRTIFLTTHYMEEAEELADRICILFKGSILRMGTIKELLEGSNVGKIVYKGPLVRIEKCRIYKSGEYNVIETENIDKTLQELVKIAERNNIRIEDIRIERLKLEDLFEHMVSVDMENKR